MSEDISKEDRDWLNSLAGEPPKDADPVISAEALAVRKALARRRDEIEADAARASGVEELRTRLQREGLMGSSDKAKHGNGLVARIKGFFGLGFGSGSVNRFPVWGFAATLALAILLTMQMPRQEPDEATVVRGDAHAVTLIVENPEARANEIVAGINEINPDAVQMTRLGNGSIQLLIRDSQAVQDYLLAQRLEAVAVEGNVKILVVPLKK